MDTASFYLLHPRSGLAAVPAVHAVPAGEVSTIDTRALVTGAHALPGAAFRVTQPRGPAFDLVGTTRPPLLMVSERVAAVLRAERVTGWETLPVDVRDEDGAPLPGFFGLRVTGRCGRIDRSRSIPVPRPANGDPRRTVTFWHGLWFDGWDGCDIFRPDGSPHVFVVERVRQILAAQAVLGLGMTRASDFESESN